MALQVLRSRRSDATAVNYIKRLGVRVPRSLGLPTSEKLVSRTLAKCHGRRGCVYITTSYVCFESASLRPEEMQDESSEEEAEEDVDVSEQIIIQLRELSFLKRESSTLLEVGRPGETVLLEGFAKEARERVFTEIVEGAQTAGCAGCANCRVPCAMYATGQYSLLHLNAAIIRMAQLPGTTNGSRRRLGWNARGISLAKRRAADRRVSLQLVTHCIGSCCRRGWQG